MAHVAPTEKQTLSVVYLGAYKISGRLVLPDQSALAAHGTIEFPFNPRIDVLLPCTEFCGRAYAEAAALSF